MIITPRGLVIYLSRDYAFAMITRLYPKFDAFQVLEAVQGLYKTHNVFAFFTGIICFSLQLDPIRIAIWSFSVPLLFFILRHHRILILPGQLKISIIYSRITGFGLVTIALILVGVLTVGIIGTVTFFMTQIILEVITVLIDKNIGTKLAIGMGENPHNARASSLYCAPIIDFGTIYQLYALEIGAPLNKEPTQEELQEENWGPVWDDFARKWPQVAARYPQNMN